MDTSIPSEILLNITEYLNPGDRWRYSATCRQLRDLLKVPLRIRIVSKSSNSCLKAKLYVSPADTPETILNVNDVLQYGVEYLFWTYDYQRENKVFLGKHGYKMLYREQPHCLYTLGLRPKHPDQTWKISQGGAGGGRSSLEGEPVPFDTAIGLDVGGKNPEPHRPDSNRRLYLSAHTLTLGALWYVIQSKWGEDEEIQLMRCQDYSPCEEVVEKELIVHAVPDIWDGGYSVYSPQSLQHGDAKCDLFHATVDFHYWIEKGVMYFQTLDFSFGVPILEEDNLHQTDPTSPLDVLRKKNSSRWWAIKHYMSTAAGAAAGNEVELETFIRSAKDHEDHTILWDEERQLVYIDVRDAVVDKKFPDFQRNENETWQFLLCA